MTNDDNTMRVIREYDEKGNLIHSRLADGTRPTRPEKYAKGSHEVAMVKYHEVLMENYADELADYATALEARLAACASDAGMPEREPHSDECWTAEVQGCVCDVDERYETALRRYAEALRARIAELETLVTTLIDRIDDWMVPCPDCNGEENY